MIFDKNDKLIMIGDSITDCGRKPAGEGLFDPYGNGYVNMVKAFLDAAYPDRPVRLVNKGVSGNTVRSLEQRWQEDVIDHKPDWLSIFIGINDVWRHFDTPMITEGHVGLDEYRSTLDRLIVQTLPNLKGLILMGPYFIENNKNDPMRMEMERYAGAVKELAQKHQAIFVDTQSGVDEMLKSMHPMTLAWDRIHPNASGHAQLARSFLKSVGYTF